MRSRAVSVVMLVLVGLFCAGPARAHPDMAATVRVLFDFHDDRLTGIAESFAFDTATSVRLLARADVDRNGVLDPAEAERLSGEIAASLKVRGFFTQMTIGGRPVPLAVPLAAEVVMQDAIVVLRLVFSVSDMGPVSTGERLELMLRDRDLMLAFRFAADRPLLLRGDGGRCSARIEPRPGEAYFGGLVVPDVAVLACR